MTSPNLEQRVAQLELQMSTLLQRQSDLSPPRREPGRDDWMSTIGMFDGDPVMREILDETLKVREDDRQRTRP